MSKKIVEEELKNFGLVLALILTVLAYLLFRKYRPSYIYFYVGGCMAVLLSILSPRLLSGIYKIFTVTGSIIGRINTALLISLIFYLVFTPVGIFCRIFKIDLLDERINKDSGTYWKKKEASSDKTHYERLF